MSEFFASYASLDARYSEHLKKFIDELKENVRSRTALALDEIGFFAKEEITTGDIWVQVLGEAVRTSKVIVCLCSPSYYNSDYCGKELAVFLDRREAWSKLAPGQQAPFILPVLWVKKNQGVPKVFKDLLQASDGKFPPAYLENGLKKLIELKGWGDGSEYKQVLVRLGDLIEEAIEKQPSLPHHPPPIVFAAVTNAFQEPKLRGAASLIISANPKDWRPFANGPAIPSILESVFTGLAIGARDLTAAATNANLGALLDEAEQHSEVVVAVVNPLSFDPAMIVALNATARKNLAVVVPWPEAIIAGPETVRAQYETLLRQGLATVASDPSGPHDFSSSRDLDKFRRSLEASVTRVRLSLLSNAVAQRKAEDPVAVATAKEEGISLAALPILTAGGDSK